MSGTGLAGMSAAMALTQARVLKTEPLRGEASGNCSFNRSDQYVRVNDHLESLVNNLVLLLSELQTCSP